MQLVVPFLVPPLGRAAVASVLAAAAVALSVSTQPVATRPDPTPSPGPPGTILAVPAADSRPVVAAGTSRSSVGVDQVVPSARATIGRPSSTGLMFTWPLSPRPGVHRRFEQPRDQWSAGHRGVDLVAVVGQQVLSAGDGVVAFSGVIAGRGVITVAHSGGLRTSYEPVDERLASGVSVHRGTRIGVISDVAGHCAPLTCLHWGAISGHAYRDPLSLLGLGRPVLLPLD